MVCRIFDNRRQLTVQRSCESLFRPIGLFITHREFDIFCAPQFKNHCCKQISETLRWLKRSNQINVHVVKTRGGECLEWCLDVALDFGSLTREAILGPIADLLADAFPYELVSDEGNALSETAGYDKLCITSKTWRLQAAGTQLTGGHVAKESVASRAKRHILQDESCVARAICCHFVTCSLRCSHDGVVNTNLHENRIYQTPRECVSHVVLLAGNVTDVCGKLRDAGQVPLLSGWPMIRNLAKSKSKWLVVGVGDKFMALQKVSEVADG